MINAKRTLAMAGAAPLLALALTACGGGGAPTDAAVDDFCAMGDELGSVFDNVADEDFDAFVDAADEASTTMEEVGTTEDIPDDARAGFESVVDALGELEAQEVEDSVDDLTKAAESGEDIDENKVVSDLFGIEDGDLEDFEAFSDYTEETC